MIGEPKSYNKLVIEYIKASEKLRIDINKEQKLINMLDQCLLCIYLMTGDEPFYNINKEKLIQSIKNKETFCEH